MATKIVDFPRSPTRNRSQTINIPNLTSIESITVNTGTVTHEVNGENVTVNVSNGASVDYDSYTPSSFETDYRETSPGGSASSLPSSVPYSSGGYSGTLNADGGAFLDRGSPSYSDTKASGDVQLAGASLWHIYRWDGNDWKYQSGYFGSTSQQYTDSSGYSGTLTLKTYQGDQPYPPSIVGSYVGELQERFNTGYGIYSGTLSKTFPDTRVWRRNYSGYVYGSKQYTYYYTYKVTIVYVDRVKLGVENIRLSATTLELPVYDPNIGMEGKNQLRIALANGKIGCFELIETNNSKASPMRVGIRVGTRAAAKE